LLCRPSGRRRKRPVASRAEGFAPRHRTALPPRSDVGGGFGYKGVLLAEEVVLAWATGKLGHPLRWIEDRRENLTAGANCREHHYRLTAYADRDGRLLGLDCEATVDAGAYSAYPFSACLEAGQIGSILPGVYDFPHYRCRTYSVATNKPPILPYRGVARTGACFALELTLDAGARPWHRAGGLTHAQPGASRAEAAIRFRRLSRGVAAGRRRDRARRAARTAAGTTSIALASTDTGALGKAWDEVSARFDRFCLAAGVDQVPPTSGGRMIT
jgi:Molybdopterin-binding domain of aldehyde dehydrogenase